MAVKKIKINGKDVELASSETISDVIEERQILGKMFVIEKNGYIVQKQEYSNEKISEGDVIEIVGFFGGG